MPLVRVEVRNEYALGAPELWREATKEDPKGVLEGVAVAGLVGVLRQLGDLAEFSAEVFHGLQEEVSVTFLRSHKLMARVKRIEATLPPLEKVVLAQRSHLHFAYTAGSNWHRRIRCKQNHFVYSEVPHFIMDSYADSHDPPRLHLLDRFDPGGPGSCLKRYSNPTFFRRASGASAGSTGKTSKEKKGRRIKKRSSWSKSGEVSRGASFSYHSERMHFTELSVGKHTSPTQTVFTGDPTLRSDWVEESNLDFRNGSGYIGGDFCPSYSTQPEEQESRISLSSIKRRDSDFLDYNFLDGKIADVNNDNQVKQSLGQARCGSSSVRYDEKTRTLEPRRQEYDHGGAPPEHNYDQEPLPQLFDPGTMGSHAVNFETAGEMDIQSCSNQVLPTLESVDIHLVDGDPESVPKNYDLETVSNKSVNVETADIMDIRSCNQTVPTLASGDIRLEDAESETDDYVDALNIIESESATDTEFTRKQKVQHYSKMEDKAVDDGQGEVIRHVAESQPSTSEFNVPGNNSLINGSCELQNPIPATPLSPPAAYNSSISEAETKNELKLVSVVDEALLCAQRARESINSGSPVSVDSHKNNCIDDDTNPESVSCTGSITFPNVTSGMPIIDGTRSTSDFSKPGPETVNVASTMIWTNGGLLGLQPSKPPDLSGLNAHPHENSCKKDEVAGKPSETLNQKIEEGPNMDTTTDDYQESGMLFRKPTWKLAPADLDVKHGKRDSHYPKSVSSTGASATASGSMPVTSAFQAAKKHEENVRSSSQIFDLSNRLLTTESNKKLLSSGEQNSNTTNYQNGNSHGLKNSENDAHQTLYGRTKDLFGVDSLIESPSSSPPIQHMKIMLRPIDGFEISKLKMKFSDGSEHESSTYIFPSFQLVPEVSVTRHNVGSDSDDDSFYRSSPSLSDDCISHHSESNSEVWESGESPRSKDHELYDALQRISLTEYVSTVPENCSSINGDTHHDYGLQFPVQNCINSQLHHPFDLQSLDTLNHSFREEPRIDTQCKNLVEPQMAPNPVPPPLPPVQCRGMKPHEDVIEEKCAAVPEGRNYTFDVKLSESIISQQPKPAPFSHDQIIETTNLQKSKVFNSQKSNGQREANQGKGADEKEDFLQQIRRKSFNLRPIATAKTRTPSEASTNVQVTAILEKANAIRQAVGSDNGEDDSNWSDS